MNIYLTIVFTTETVHYIGERIEMRLKEQSVCIRSQMEHAQENHHSINWNNTLVLRHACREAE